jgi:CBF1 interacting corepressor
MVQGMAFLSKKGFNPHNKVNRTQVYEAQQHSKLEKERARKRAEELRREQEDEELCAARHNGDGSQAQLRFMYDAPPGLTKDDEKQQQAANSGNSSSEAAKDLTQVQPGDDAAAAAFRRMLAATTQPVASNSVDATGSANQEATDEEIKLGFAPVLQGSMMERDLERSNDTRSALEKAVGRKDRDGALTLDEQTKRFPQLKNAPMAKGMSLTDVNVSFKPLGAMLRNVKCLACGIWGHSRGDRECKMTGWDPFSASTVRPVSASIKPSKEEESTRRDTIRENDVSRPSVQKDGDDASSSSSSSSDDSRRKRKRKHRSKHKKREKESSHRKRSRKHRSKSSSRRSKSDSDKKQRSKRDDY